MSDDTKLPVKRGYDPERATRIVEKIAAGELMDEFAGKDGLPSKATIYRWLALDQEFFDAVERARKSSAMGFEEEALAMARELRAPNDFTGTKVQAFNVAMQQMRWSAEKRDRARYGSQANNEGMVQIVIKTDMNIGQPGAGPVTKGDDDIFKIDLPLPAVEAAPEADIELKPTDISVAPDNPFAVRVGPEPEPDTVSSVIPVPDKMRRKLPRKPRLRKGHKSETSTKRTASIYAKRQQKTEGTNDGRTSGPAGAGNGEPNG